MSKMPRLRDLRRRERSQEAFRSPAVLSPSFERRPPARSTVFEASLSPHLARGRLLVLVKAHGAHPHMCAHTHRRRFAPGQPAQELLINAP